MTRLLSRIFRSPQSVRKARSVRHVPHVESLEGRVVPSGNPAVFVTQTGDRIPNFAANPTVTAVKAGSWQDPAVWSTGAVPTAADVVSIPFAVTNNGSAFARVIETVGPAGLLSDNPAIATSITCQTLELAPGSLGLQVGTPAAPVTASAKIVFADAAPDTATDPEQYGTGLLALADVTMVGQARAPFVRLAAEPHAGDTTLRLATRPDGWQPGDYLVLPDTRQLLPSQVTTSQDEQAVITAISADGLTVTLAAPLQYSHRGAYTADGTPASVNGVRLLPYVANLNRNIGFEDVNDHGTRGHTLFTDQSHVTLENVMWCGQGRTTNATADSTTFNADGTVKHLGTNQLGRYPVYLDHLQYPPTVSGCVIGNDEAGFTARWGLVVDSCSYGTFTGNVVLNTTAGAVVFLSGTETRNVVDGNYVIGSGIATGNGGSGDVRDWANDGAAFEFRGANNFVRNNVVADSAEYAYWYYSQFLGTVRVPSAPGQPFNQFTSQDAYAQPLLQFANNECYGPSAGGLNIWWVGASGTAPHTAASWSLSGFTVWNTPGNGIYFYATSGCTVDGMNYYGDVKVLNGSGTLAICTQDYYQNNWVVQNSHLEGAQLGVQVPVMVGPTPLEVRNNVIRCLTDVEVGEFWSSGVGQTASYLARVTRLDSDTFLGIPGYALTAIDMGYGGSNTVLSDQVYVTSYNGVAGDDFRVYYTQQAAGFGPLPVTALDGNGRQIVTGAPVAGLTNAQAWAQYGIATAGEIAPAGAGPRAGINGLVTPGAGVAPAAPRLVVTAQPSVTPVLAGGAIGFVVTVSNRGSAAASNVSLSEALPAPAGVTWTTVSTSAGAAAATLNGSTVSDGIGTLAPGQSVTVTVTGTTAANFSGTLTDTATVTANNNNPGSVQAPATLVVTLPPPAAPPPAAPPPPAPPPPAPPPASPHLTVVAQPSATPVASGGAVGFVVTVSNTGAGPASNVSLSEALPAPAGVTWTTVSTSAGVAAATLNGNTVSDGIGTLAPGQSVTVTVTGTTALGFSGTLTDAATATASNNNPGSVQAPATLVVTPPPPAPPHLAITVQAAATPVVAGGAVGFVVTVSNTGAGPASNVSLSEALPAPAGVTWTAVSTSAGATAATLSGNTVSDGIGTLAPGQSVTVTVTGTTALGFSGTLTDAATATAGNNNPGSVQASATLVVTPPPPPPSPHLAITAQTPATAVFAGGAISFVVTVSNTGAGPASNVSLSEALPAPAGVTWTGVSTSAGAATLSGNTVSDGIGTLAPGQSVTVTVTGTTALGFSGTLTDAATATAGNNNPGSVQASATLVVTPPPPATPRLTVVVRNAATSNAPGSAVGFMVTISNTGSAAAFNINVTEALPAHVSWIVVGTSTDGGTATLSGNTLSDNISTLAAGRSVTVYAVGTVASGFSGTLTDTATVTASNNLFGSIQAALAIAVNNKTTRS